MKKDLLKILVPLLTLLMLLSIAAPVFACSPSKPKPYSYELIGVGTSPGSVFVDSNNVQHTKGAIMDFNIFGTAWGTGSAIATQDVTLNLNTYTGHIFATVKITFSTGTASAVVVANFNGLGYFTYSGPTISANGITAHNGDKFYGLLFSGTVVRYGTGGELKGMYSISQSYNGVSMTISGVKYSLVNDDGIYRFA